MDSLEQNQNPILENTSSPEPEAQQEVASTNEPSTQEVEIENTSTETTETCLNDGEQREESPLPQELEPLEETTTSTPEAASPIADESSCETKTVEEPEQIEATELSVQSDLKEDPQEEVPAPETLTEQPVCGTVSTKEETEEPNASPSEDCDNTSCSEKTSETPDEKSESDQEESIALYYPLSREELCKEMVVLAAHKNIAEVKNKISFVRQVFAKKDKEYQDEMISKWVESGELKEDFVRPEDPIHKAFHEAHEAYREKRKQFLENQEKEQQKNLEKKKNILEELKQLIDSEETLKKTYDDFKDIQVKWKEIGQIPRNEINDLWQSYHFLIEQFFNKVKINKELRDLDLKRNLEAKIILCEKVEDLLLQDNINDSFKLLQAYQEQWREIGPVPSDKNEEIWERFRTAGSKINLRRQEFAEKLRDEQQNNLLAKTALCEKAEEILTLERSSIKLWTEQTTSLNDLFALWKTIGPVPKAQNNDIWMRFKTVLDTFFTDKKVYFDQVKEEQSENLMRKTEICAKAELIAQREDWKQAQSEIVDLQKEWKSIGFVPKKQSDKLWKRFRSACDEFFQRKSDFFAKSQESENENLQKKEAIVAEVKSFSFGESKEENLQAIKNFQQQWSAIGQVPPKERIRLQKEFRAAIDAHFDKLDIDLREQRLYAFKQDLESVGDDNKSKFLFRERRNIKDQLDRLKGDVTLWENNLGFLANSKQADMLKKEFEKKIEKNKQEIALLTVKLKMLDEKN